MEPAAHRKPRRWTAWFLPDLAISLALITLLYAVGMYRAPEQLFRDSDSGWHIRAGERMLDRHAVPRTDEYSFSRPGGEWYAWEWAVDIAMGACHRALGIRGVVLLYLAAIGLATWLWVRLHWACGTNFLLICLLAAPMLTTAQLHWLARPHVFGWCFLLFALWLLETRRMHWLLAAALGAAWTNAHGSFFLLPALCAIHATGWRAVAAASAATLLNPYGYRLHEHLMAYLTNQELLERVAEFQSFPFNSAGTWQVGAALILAIAGFVCALALGQWSRAAALLLFAIVGLRAARGMPILALAALPLAGGAITSALGQWRLAPAALARAFAYGDRLRTLQAPLHGTLSSAIFVGLMTLAVLGSHAGFPSTEFPVDAAEHVPARARLLAPDKYGGYLIYRFNGDRKVYFDGRSDYYGAAFMKEYIDLVEVRPGWERIVERYGFTHALLPPRYSLAAALEKAGWRKIHADRTAIVLERNF